MLRLAVQKSGRLTESSLTLISECGIEFERGSAKLKIPAFNFPIEIMSCRDDDIPTYLAEGVVDAAIVGENILKESGVYPDIRTKLGFGRCRLSIAIKRESEWAGIASLEGARIATSYPATLNEYLRTQGITASIREISGAVEIAPGIGVAEAICDLVSSGSTLLSNGLREVETVFVSEAVLVSSPTITKKAASIYSEFSFRVGSVLRAKNTKYITLNIPTNSIPQLIEILPGLKSPSVVELATPGWSALHTVVSEDNFWGVIGQLREVGAEGILVMPIEKVIL